MLLRLLFTLLALIVLLRMLGWRPPARRDPGSLAGGRPAAGPAPTQPSATDLVACTRCGVHVARPLALERGGRWYCSVEHRDAS